MRRAGERLSTELAWDRVVNRLERELYQLAPIGMPTASNLDPLLGPSARPGVPLEFLSYLEAQGLQFRVMQDLRAPLDQSEGDLDIVIRGVSVDELQEPVEDLLQQSTLAAPIDPRTRQPRHYRVHSSNDIVL